MMIHMEQSGLAFEGYTSARSPRLTTRSMSLSDPKGPFGKDSFGVYQLYGLTEEEIKVVEGKPGNE